MGMTCSGNLTTKRLVVLLRCRVLELYRPDLLAWQFVLDSLYLILNVSRTHHIGLAHLSTDSSREQP